MLAAEHDTEVVAGTDEELALMVGNGYSVFVAGSASKK
jgi:hypothetical protein